MVCAMHPPTYRGGLDDVESIGVWKDEASGSISGYNPTITNSNLVGGQGLVLNFLKKFNSRKRRHKSTSPRLWKFCHTLLMSTEPQGERLLYFQGRRSGCARKSKSGSHLIISGCRRFGSEVSMTNKAPASRGEGVQGCGIWSVVSLHKLRPHSHDIRVRYPPTSASFRANKSTTHESVVCGNPAFVGASMGHVETSDTTSEFRTVNFVYSGHIAHVLPR